MHIQRVHVLKVIIQMKLKSINHDKNVSEIIETTFKICCILEKLVLVSGISSRK